MGKIAVVVVHGVADQKPGDTRDQVVSLLLANAPKHVEYIADGSIDVSISTPPLRLPEDDGRDPGISETIRICKDSAAANLHTQDKDRTYSTRLVHLRRNAGPQALDHDYARGQPDARNVEVDVIEMYWADQSRLSSSGSRILSELLTVLFRLSTLGRETVSSVHPGGTGKYPPKQAAKGSACTAPAQSTAPAHPQQRRQQDRDPSGANGDSGSVSQPTKGPGTALRKLVRNAAWRWFVFFQQLIDVLLVHVIAMLGLAFALSVGIMCALALAASLRPSTLQHVVWIGWLLLAIVALLAVLYQLPGRWWPFAPERSLRLVLPLLAAAGVVLLAIAGRFGEQPDGSGWFEAPQQVVFWVVVAMACMLHYAAVHAVHQRFGVARGIAYIFWFVALAVLLGTAGWDADRRTVFGFVVPDVDIGDLPFAHAIRNAYASGFDPYGQSVFAPLLIAALRSSEVLLAIIKYSWIVMAACVTMWFVLSVVACLQADGKYIRQGSIATGRLGFGLSMVSVLLVSMLVWAALSESIQLSVKDVVYRPLYFDNPQPESAKTEKLQIAYDAAKREVDSVRTASAAASATLAAAQADLQKATLCMNSAHIMPGTPIGVVPPPSASSPPERLAWIDAACFMSDRYVGSTVFFAPIAAWMGIVLAYLVIMLAPCIAAEFEVKLGGAYQHGKWLTHLYRFFDAFVGGMLLLTAVGVTIVAIDFFGLVKWLQGRYSDGWMHDALTIYQDVVTDLVSAESQKLLRHVVISAASVATAFVVFGGFLSRNVPGLRAPLDAALDVDNWFRRWPKGKEPRAMMMARFDALLDWLEPKYDRIVVVAHSQGTVITADLMRLRYRRSEAICQKVKPIHFVTFGSPLRQLYAARFPELYQWMLHAKDGIGGPELLRSGIVRWTNGFCSGDYVGRWLWSQEDKTATAAAGGVIRHPAHDQPHDLVAIHLAKPLTPYAEIDFSKVAWQQVLDSDRVECCLGYGAHTHYFDIGKTGSAALIDSAIARAAIDISIEAAQGIAASQPAASLASTRSEINAPAAPQIAERSAHCNPIGPTILSIDRP